MVSDELKRWIKTHPTFYSAWGKYLRTRGAIERSIGAVSEQWNWLKTSNEFGNPTYALTEQNRTALIAFVGNVANIPYEEAEKYLVELHEDEELKSHIRRESKKIVGADPFAQYGRRAGWYAIVRAQNPM